MADPKPSTSDCIMTSETAIVNSAIPEEPPSIAQNIESLDLVEPQPMRTKLRTYATLLALYLVCFVTALDQTIVATSIPTICTSLGSASGYTWIGAVYLLANAAAGPIWAKCSDIWGRKLALLISVASFAVASMIAALSIDMRMLIAARAIQGTAGAGLSQLVSITISDLFGLRDRALFLGFMGLMWAVAGSAGPLIGGALTEFVSWRWCFWINLPVCGLAFTLLVLFLDVHNPHTSLREGFLAIDWIGTLSIVTVTLLILLGLEYGGSTFAWNSPKVICLIVFGTLMIGFFLFNEKRIARYPLMPLAVFESSSNNATFLVAIGHTMVSIGIEYYLPLYFQSVKQSSPLRSGLLILPLMVTESIVDVLVGIAIHRTGRYRDIIWVGVAFMTLGTGLYIQLQTHTPIATIIGFQIIGGIGVACLFQAPMMAVQNTVSQADTAGATATLGFFRNLAASFSIVLGGLAFQNSMASQHSTLAAAGIEASVLDVLTSSQAAANLHIVETIEDAAQRLAVKDAFAWSIRNIFVMYTGIAAVALVASVGVKQYHMSKEHTETKTGVRHMTERKTEK
ncbi:putative MFS transporter [Aureobasidium sp. EXF-3400]|nr:putative MFS transporter [Aureobasidium sp. EXF-12344]KAI4771210.1 putative MFS transporter [Aureobasidium sp. EXF-3400]